MKRSFEKCPQTLEAFGGACDKAYFDVKIALAVEKVSRKIPVTVSTDAQAAPVDVHEVATFDEEQVDLTFRATKIRLETFDMCLNKN